MQYPVAYMERTRKNYCALSYDQDYSWSLYDDVLFVRLSEPLSDCRISFVMMAGPTGAPNLNHRGRKWAWFGVTAPALDDLLTMNVAWDKEVDAYVRSRVVFSNRDGCWASP